MAAPALRYCLVLAWAGIIARHEIFRGEVLEGIHQIAECMGVQKQSNDALQQQSAGSVHVSEVSLEA
jgi:hypothetical protein